MKRQTKKQREKPKKAHTGLGADFWRRRTEAGITQEELARPGVVSVRTVRKVERNVPCSSRMRVGVLRGLNHLREQRGYASVEIVGMTGSESLVPVANSWLRFPDRQWLSRVHGPGALLRADNRVVPFHGQASLRELGALRDWCLGAPAQGIRVYRGAGGSGKTRLGVELCHQLTNELEPAWNAGFAEEELFDAQWASGPSGAWGGLRDLRRPLLIVVDYAGDVAKANMISKLLEHLATCPAPKVRLLFLERDDLWMDRLHVREPVREILLGPLLWCEGGESARELPPVASSPNERDASWRAAAKAFAAKLEMKNPGPPPVCLGPKRYGKVLVIHSQALLTVIGTKAETETAILRHLLAREREYWSRRLESQGLPLSLLPAVEQAVYQISLVKRVPDRQGALRRLAKVSLLEGQPPLVLEQMVTLLRECYPEGQSGIGPLQPDSLKEFLVRRCQGKE